MTNEQIIEEWSNYIENRPMDSDDISDWWIAKLDIARNHLKGEMVREIVICAAVRASDGIVIRGHRHAHAMRWLKQIPGYENEHPYGDNQGFVTSLNRYVTRKQGYEIQKDAGIESVCKEGDRYLGDELYSEDLY